MKSKEKGEEAIDVSDIGAQVTDYVCLYCGVIMLPLQKPFVPKSNVQAADTNLTLSPQTRQNMHPG
jgi:hypothetical protein